MHCQRDSSRPTQGLLIVQSGIVPTPILIWLQGGGGVFWYNNECFWEHLILRLIMVRNITDWSSINTRVLNEDAAGGKPLFGWDWRYCGISSWAKWEMLFSWVPYSFQDFCLWHKSDSRSFQLLRREKQHKGKVGGATFTAFVQHQSIQEIYGEASRRWDCSLNASTPEESKRNEGEKMVLVPKWIVKFQAPIVSDKFCVLFY